MARELITGKDRDKARRGDYNAAAETAEFERSVIVFGLQDGRAAHKVSDCTIEQSPDNYAGTP